MAVETTLSYKKSAILRPKRLAFMMMSGELYK